jgi:DNA-directed RNA polymerase subunit H
MPSSSLSDLCRVNEHLIKICAARGFDGSAIPTDHVTVKAMKNHNTLNLALSAHSGDRTLFIHYESRDVKKQDIQKILEAHYDGELKEADTLIIIADEVTQEKSVYEELRKQWDGQRRFIQVFPMSALKYAPSDQADAHRVLTADEVVALKKARHLTEELGEVGCILRHDAMARWIGARPGDIVEIQRKSPTSGITVTYRKCIEP